MANAWPFSIHYIRLNMHAFSLFPLIFSKVIKKIKMYKTIIINKKERDH